MIMTWRSTTAGVDGQNLSANHDRFAPVRDIATAAGIYLGRLALAMLSAKHPVWCQFLTATT
jgi:hypothetical protein